MTRKRKTVAAPAQQGGIPYQIDGKRVTLAEYRTWSREQQRLAIVAELRSDPGETTPGETEVS